MQKKIITKQANKKIIKKKYLKIHLMKKQTENVWHLQKVNKTVVKVMKEILILKKLFLFLCS